MDIALFFRAMSVVFVGFILSYNRVTTFGICRFADGSKDMLSISVVNVFVGVVIFVILGFRIVVEVAILVFTRVFRWGMCLVLVAVAWCHNRGLDLTLVFLVVAVDLRPVLIVVASFRFCGLVGVVFWCVLILRNSTLPEFWHILGCTASILSPF